MNENIKLEDLGDKIASIIQSYGGEVQSKANECLGENAKNLCKDIPVTSIGIFNDGNSTNHLRNSFIVTKKKNGDEGNVSYIVHASTKDHKYAIVHLVENGHINYYYPNKSKNLPEIEPRPFLSPLLEVYKPIIQQSLIQVINECKGDSITTPLESE